MRKRKFALPLLKRELVYKLKYDPSVETTINKTFDAVRFMRDQRQRLSEKLANMTKEEILEYFKKKETENSVKPSA